jgi:MFS family permease
MPWIKLQTFPRSPVASSSRHTQSDAPSRPSNDSKPSDDLDIQDASTPAVGSAELSSQMGRRTRTESSSEKPYHVFTPRMKSFVVLVVSAVAALSGLSSNIYFPAQQDISIVRLAHPCPRQNLPLPFFADCFAQKGLGISPEVVNLSITTYMIAQGLGPSFWAPLADWQGRRTTLVYTLLLYVASNVALALTTNSAMLLAFRALQAIGSSSTIALGAGVIADISPPNERGGYIGWFSGGECRNVPQTGGPFEC